MPDVTNRESCVPGRGKTWELSGSSPPYFCKPKASVKGKFVNFFKTCKGDSRKWRCLEKIRGSS